MFTDSDADIHAKIHKRYSDMKSYAADVKITVKSNKTENVYTAKQFFSEPDTMSVEFNESGTLYLIKNGMAVLKKGENELSFPAANSINYLFINEFFKLYYTSQDTAITVSSDEVLSVTRLETELIGSTSKRNSAVLTVNNKTLSPERLVIYDFGKNPVIEVDFLSFIYNAKSENF